MKKNNQKSLCAAVCGLAAFVLWTLLVRSVDVQSIGPMGSAVGFATLNGYVRDLVGVHMPLYVLTDWLGLVPIVTAMGFAVFGLAQWIRRKSLRRVDRSILALGVFYIAVAAAYGFFEAAVINYRPVLIEGILEASYPSSTTLLVACVMPTAAMQLGARIKNQKLRRCAIGAIVAFTVLTVLGRLFSGVHWITDIVGGLLLSAGLVSAYRAAWKRE